MNSFRGVGLEEGLSILAAIRETLGVPVITDVHDVSQVIPAAEVVDMLQTPAFLCRQSDFIAAVATAGKPVNIKKGQFLAPWDMAKVIEKATIAAGDAGVSADFFVCERGSTFGYGNLVVDMRGLTIMRETSGCPVVFDATHSVQLPGAKGESSGGGVSMRRFWRALRSPLGPYRACSWKPIPIRITRRATDRTCCRSNGCPTFWRSSKP